MSGIIFLYITYIIVKNNLVELGKVLIYELIAIITLGFSNVILFINDLLYTYSYYSDETSALIVNIGLLITFQGYRLNLIQKRVMIILFMY